MKVLVSACIMGENCKYNGKNNKNSAAIHFLKDKEVISICPEVLAGMETPRPCAEIVNGRVVDENGNDVSLEYNKAVAVALSKIQNEEIDLVILNQIQLAGMNLQKLCIPITVGCDLLLHTLIPIALDECA